MRFYLLYLCAIASLELNCQSIYSRARQLIDQNELDRSYTLLDSCFKKSYFADSALYYKSIAYLKDQKPEKALQLSERLIHEYPDFTDVHLLLGMIYFAQNNFGKSIDSFNRHLELSPDHFKSLQNRALAEAMLEDYEAALSDLDKAVELAPLNSQIYYSRGYWRNIVGKTEEAISDFNKTIELDPKNYDAYLGLAQIYHNQKNIQKACESVERASAAGSQIAEELKRTYCN
jgi:tetratricopeptide (TPR) repeat protein